MKRIVFVKEILLLLMILTISLSGFSKEKEVKSFWAASSVKIDGFKDDWAEVAFDDEKKVKIDYYIL